MFLPVIALAIGTAVALAGCTSDPPVAAPYPTPSSTAGAALNSLLPVVPETLTAATAKTETVRVADAIQDLIAATEIVHVADTSKLFAATKTTGEYYGVLRTVNVTTSLDPIAQSSAMVQLMEAAGWIERNKSNKATKYVATLSSDADGNRSWFALIGGDATEKKLGVVTIQIISPDLP